MSLAQEEEFFEIISTFFANSFFNTLYAKARDDYNDNKFLNIEDAYKSTVNIFNNAVSEKKYGEHYVVVLESIKNEYNKYASTKYDRYSFVDFCAKFLIPTTENISFSEKEEAVKKYFVRVISVFSIFCTTSQLKTAISLEIRNNKEKMRETIVNWKTYMKKICSDEKNRMCSLILMHKNGIPQNPAESVESVQKLQNIIKKLIQEKAALVRERNNLVKLVHVFKNIIKDKNTALERTEFQHSRSENLRSEKLEPKKEKNQQREILKQIEKEDTDEKNKNLANFSPIIDKDENVYEKSDEKPEEEKPEEEKPEEKSDETEIGGELKSDD